MNLWSRSSWKRERYFHKIEHEERDECDRLFDQRNDTPLSWSNNMGKHIEQVGVQALRESKAKARDNMHYRKLANYDNPVACETTFQKAKHHEEPG